MIANDENDENDEFDEFDEFDEMKMWKCEKKLSYDVLYFLFETHSLSFIHVKWIFSTSLYESILQAFNFIRLKNKF